MKAFQDDLRARGLEEKVLTVTTSEFGRRVHSNGSYGTDHGTGGPIMIFGRAVVPGVVGVVPDMTKDNIEMQFDYRQIYANLLKDWMEVDQAVITNDIFFGNFIDGPREEGGNYEPLPLATSVITGNEDFIAERYALGHCYPNPAKTVTNIQFKINHQLAVNIDLFDSRGDRVRNLVNGAFGPGSHSVQVQISDLKPGAYIYQMKAGSFKESRKMIVVK
jgi:hypothetical protein